MGRALDAQGPKHGSVMALAGGRHSTHGCPPCSGCIQGKLDLQGYEGNEQGQGEWVCGRQASVVFLCCPVREQETEGRTQCASPSPTPKGRLRKDSALPVYPVYPW